MKLSKRWNRIFSVVITAILVASLLITYPAFNVTRANGVPSTAELTYNRTLAKIYVDESEVHLIDNNTLVTEYNEESGVYYWNGSDFVEVGNKGPFFIVEANQDIEVNVSSTDNIKLSLDDSTYENALNFTLTAGSKQTIYVDVSTVSTPSFGVITFVFTNASGYHEDKNYYVYVTQALTSDKISPSDTDVAEAELSSFEVTWTNMSSLGVDYYEVYLYKDSEQVAYYTVTTNSIDYATISEKFELVNGHYTIWVIPHWGGYWDVPGIGSYATFNVDTVEPTIEYQSDESDIFTGQNDTTSPEISLVYIVNGTYSDIKWSTLHVYIVNNSNASDVWVEGSDYTYSHDEVSLDTNLYKLWINITVNNDTEGIYRVYVNVSDVAGNPFNNSEAVLIVDNSIPSVELEVYNTTSTIKKGAAHVIVTITDNYEEYGSIDISTIKIKRTVDTTTTTIIEYDTTEGKLVSRDPLVIGLTVSSGSVVIEFYDYNVSTGATPEYSVEVYDFSGNINDTVTNDTTIEDDKNPVVSEPVIKVPVGEGDVYMTLSDYLPVGTQVMFVFEVTDEHIQYFNVSFNIASYEAKAYVEFLKDPIYNETLVENYDYKKNSADSVYVTVDDISVERKGALEDFTYYVNITITVDSTAMDTGVPLIVTWNAKDFSGNNGPTASGYKNYQLSEQNIDIYNLTATPQKDGKVTLSWEIDGTGNYSGFLVYASKTGTSGSWELVYNGLGSTATTVTIDNSTLEEKLSISYGTAQTVYFKVYAITHDARSDSDTVQSTYDSAEPEITVSESSDLDDVYVDGESIYINYSVTDEGTGVDWNNITVDASAVNASGATWIYNATNGWINVTITFDKGVTGIYNITISVPDIAGNIGEKTVQVKVDNAGPEATLISAPEETYAGNTINIQVNITDWPSKPVVYNLTIGDQYVYNDTFTAVEGNNVWYWNDTITIQVPDEAGTYDITIYLEDAEGNNRTVTLGTIEIYPAEPTELKINLVELNGETTDFTEGADYYVVFVGDHFMLKATIYDQYDNVLSSEDVSSSGRLC